MEASDAELLQRSVSGDKQAFNTLMRRHESRIYSLAYRMLGNRSDALDATQDTFVNVYRRASDFRGDSAFSTWVYRVGINRCKDLLRKKGQAPVPTEELFETDPQSGGLEDNIVLRDELEDHARAATGRLPRGGCYARHRRDPLRRDSNADGGHDRNGQITHKYGRRQLAQLLEQGGASAASKEMT